MRKIKEDLTGKKFINVEIIGRADDYVSPGNITMPQWLCLCKCGAVFPKRRADILKFQDRLACVDCFSPKKSGPPSKFDIKYNGVKK